MSVSVKSNSNGTAGSIQVNGTDVITFDSTGNLTATSFTGTISSQSLSSSGNLTFSTNSTEKLRIGTSGEIGIGGANYGTAGQVLTSGGSGAATSWSTLSASSLSGTGSTSGQVLMSTGSGTAPTWSTFSTLPTQSGNSGKFLTTDGTNAAWSSISTASLSLNVKLFFLSQW